MASQNRFINFFNGLISKEKKSETAQTVSNAQGTGYVDNDLIELQKKLNERDSIAFAYNNVSNQNSDFIDIVNSKKSKIIRYNSMMNYPEIHEGTEIIVNESISKDGADEICKLNIKEDIESIPANIKKIYDKCFKTVYYDLYDFDTVADILFEKLFVEAELFIELIANKEKTAIIGYQILPAYTMLPIYNKMNVIDKFIQINDHAIKNSQKLNANISKDDIIKEFSPNQIIYMNSGKYGNSLYDVRSPYDVIMKTFNHLKMIDDSLAIYRWTRAPEMRLFNVYTGRMQSGKAQNFLKNLAKKYAKVNDYNYSTGEISQKSHIKSIIDDLWFAVGEDGNKTEVDSISGGMNLGELDDVKVFIAKLYKGLGIPRGRYNSEEMGDWQANSESITRDEQQFAQKLEKYKRNFSPIILKPFEILLKLEGIDEKWINKKYYSIEFNKASKYQLFLDAEMWNTKMDIYGNTADLIYHPEDNPTGTLSSKWVLINKCGFTEAELEENKKLIEEQKKLEQETENQL